MDTKTDAILIGGGLVGMVTALALAAFGVRTVVIDAADLEATVAPDFDGRATAIASASWRMFRALGLSDRLTESANPINEIRVTEGLRRAHLHFDGREADGDPLGHMVENRHLRRALIDAGQAESLIDIRAPARTSEIDRAEHGVTVTLDNGDTVRAPLLIGADGRRSRIRDAAGIRIARWQYDQTAIVGMIEHEKSHGDVAFELFYPAGPFAILPMRPGTRSAIVWTVEGDDAKAYLGLPPRALAAEIDKKIGGFLGQITIAATPSSYPLGFHHATAYTASRLALVGDAAHGIHPIAGQGLNMGLRDAAALAEVVGDAVGLGLDIGEAEVLERYSRWRGFDNVAVAASTDILNRFFGLPGKTMSRVRAFGLGAVERAGPLKQFFMSEARGASGDLPQLLRGERP
ncbi:UbiH/UbiF/VisC/COQ6 family ubiquinone biosynthesis hydroxylase [Pacificimonas sp. WHA3]|uniref:UbiH/UbiF/VisC/COQ6 family ubiquinone biosynthesis hydroxylase n=1 Tax=Pacificimonas pallii TaxID=2827236 RepID=A0ABS6SDW7_9SPHN|nr:UbiH/UbiF/VisC/COQ6 family ubiquinone biosynthesis hydroxylase [Pacificimonas pallii]MBV7256111.1 UbiH/UbiF/VisC/COQ6 family ubiquinone biosynthesis hydroxylase [Pacificimonas pallii]